MVNTPQGDCEAAVVGSGPNGLAAGIVLARQGLSTTIFEAGNAPGGAVRSDEITLPGYIHDTGSAVHPMAVASPFMSALPLERFGLEWVCPPAAVAHPFDDGTAIILHSSIIDTCDSMGVDGRAYRNLIQPLVDDWAGLTGLFLGDFRHIPNPLMAARFGVIALNSAESLAGSRFKSARARGFFAGLAAHSVLPLDRMVSAAFGLVLAAAGHAVGWPMPRGGSGSISQAMINHFKSLGGRVMTNRKVLSLRELTPAKAVFLDTSPEMAVKICGDRLPDGYRNGLLRYKHGPGIFKIDWALAGQIPWKAADCIRAGTVHLGGEFKEIAAAEMAAWQGKITSRPFVLLAQPSLFDSTRAPVGKHTAWAYCHVPNGCGTDYTEIIEAQVERFAPGFLDLVLARAVAAPRALEAENANLAGGDIVGGSATIKQMICRPTCTAVPYRLPIPGVYICSASTPPGAGVHGMCGYHAASAYLRGCKK
jgi:phytoene dehydrogenase-like protein